MTVWLFRYLAMMAAHERDGRVRHYPAMIAAGEITPEDASVDIEAWDMLAELLEGGLVRLDVPWATLEQATSLALQRREDALAACPEGDKRRPGLVVRRDAVSSIHERIAHQAALPARPILPGTGRGTAAEGGGGGGPSPAWKAANA